MNGLQYPAPKVSKQKTLWKRMIGAVTCTCLWLHLIATISQRQKLVVQYTKEHAYFLSRTHLHYELTGKMLPCVKDTIDIVHLIIPQPSSKPSLKTAAEHGNKDTCVDHAVDKTNAETTALGSMVSLFVLSMFELIIELILIS
jgi:hypothetical protein